MPKRRPTQAAGDQLLGRRRERAEIERLLAGEARLVSLVGCGGIGKTALARAVAGGGLFVDLAEARSERDLRRSLAAVLGPRVPDTLLVLDNLEQIAGIAAPVVAELLAGAPGLSILATSRVPLGLSTEHRVDVGPLDPDSAAALFVRAALRRGVRDPDRAMVMAIVREVEAIPLAVELAAGRLGVLSLEELRERLGHTLEVLRGDHSDTPPRHRSMRATVEWSWDACEEGERRALAQLAAFRAGFDLAGAEAILRGPALAAVERLRDLGMVHRVARHRYAVYEVVRELAVERMPRLAAGAAARHTAWFVASARRHAAAPYTAESAGFRADEAGNLIAVIDRTGPSEEAAWCLVALDLWLWATAPDELARRADEIGSALPARDDNRELRAALFLAAGAARTSIDPPAARRDLEAAITLTRPLGPNRVLARALRWLRAALELDAPVESAEAGRAFAEVASALGHADLLALACADQGADLHRRDEEAAAADAYRRAVALHHAAGNRIHEAITAANLATALVALGRDDEAAGAAARARDVAEPLDNPRVASAVELAQARVAFGRGDAAEARQHARAMRAREAARSDPMSVAIADLRLAEIEHLAGELGRAMVLASDALAGFERLGRERHAAVARCQLAALLARRGQIDEAERELAAATRAGHLVDVYRGFLSLARARSAAPEQIHPMVMAAVSALAAPSRSEDIYTAVRLLGDALRAELGTSAPIHTLAVERDGAWFAVDGGRPVALEARPILARALATLVAARRPLDDRELFARIWPGERALPRAAQNRVWVALSTLRRLGLRELLVRGEGGTALASGVAVVAV